MKKHYIPVTSVPIFYYLRSASTTINKDYNGFKVVRVVCPSVLDPSRVFYFYERGTHVWIEGHSRPVIKTASMVKLVNTTDLKSVG